MSDTALHQLSVDELEQIYGEAEWLTDRSFTWPELEALRDTIRAGQRSTAEDTAAEDSPKHNTSEKPDEDVKEDPHPPEMVAAHGQEALPPDIAAVKPAEFHIVHPAVPVNVGEPVSS